MVTVGVNLLWLVPGVVGGSEEYTIRLLRALDETGDHGLRLRLYGQKPLFETHPDLGQRFEAVVAPSAARRPIRVGLENTWLAARSSQDRFVHHAGGVVPFVRRAPAVLTIHDLQPLEMPGHFSWLKRTWLRLMIPFSARSARLVLCPSEFTAERVSTLLGVKPDRVRVVAHGHEPTEPGVLDPEVDAGLRARYGRFLLLPAITYRHKRHADLVIALDQLRDRFPDVSVVITGRPDSEAAELAALTSRLGLTGRVHQLGRIPEDELDALYRSAAALVFPSEYEGFGNPILEAMARGCPVVTSDAGALPEVCGLAGLVVPTGNPVALAQAIARVLDEPHLADELRRAGVERAARFSWDEAGVRLAGCYREALDLAG